MPILINILLIQGEKIMTELMKPFMKNVNEGSVDAFEAINMLAPKNAGAHNAFYRGKDLTEYFNSGDMSTAIANGTFDDIFPGDYITKSVTINGTAYSNVKWYIGDCDYYYNFGDTACTKHHVLIFPEKCLGTAQMNSSNVTTGGYVGSAMWTSVIPKYVTGIQNAFGSTHILSHRELLTKTLNANGSSTGYSPYTGITSDWAWYDVTANLFNESMVYGTGVFESSGFEHGSCYAQIAAFKHNRSLTVDRANHTWLRTVVSGTNFALADYNGGADPSYASHAYGVRPYSLLT